MNPYIASHAPYDFHPDSHAARHGVTCRSCGTEWPCPARNDRGHDPNLIPNGVVITTYDDLDRLVSWAPGGYLPVVLDRAHTPWILFSDDHGDGYARTVPCPDEGTSGLCDLQELPAHGPLRVIFNGDPHNLDRNTDTTGRENQA